MGRAIATGRVLALNWNHAKPCQSVLQLVVDYCCCVIIMAPLMILLLRDDGNELKLPWRVRRQQLCALFLLVSRLLPSRRTNNPHPTDPLYTYRKNPYNA